MQIEDILDDMPTTPQERVAVIENLLESIERMNTAIQRHESYPEQDNLAIEQFTDLRTIYVGQFGLLLSQYGLVVQVQTPPNQTGKATT